MSNVSAPGSGGSGPGSGAIFTINTISPDGSGNFTLTAGTNITLTPGTNALTISSSGISSITVDGDTGSASGSTIKLTAGTSSQLEGSSVSFSASGSTVNLNLTDSNGNIIIGAGSGNAGITSTNNSSLGKLTLSSLTSGSGSNIAIGRSSLTSGTSIVGNTSVGVSSLGQLLTGQYNCCFGYDTGFSYTGSESYNILIGDGVTGTVGESNICRIGNTTASSGGGAISKTYIQGIYNNDSSGFTSPLAVFIDSTTGQLGYGTGGGGSVTLTGDTGTASGSTITLYTNVASNFGTVEFQNSGTTSLLSFTDSQNNTCIGANSIQTPAAFHSTAVTFLGSGCGSESSNLTQVTTIGYNSMSGSGLCQRTVAIGDNCCNNINSLALGNSSDIVAVGSGALANISGNYAGSYVTCIGSGTATNYTGTESSNILIGYNVAGVASENNTLHIGVSTGTGNGELNSAFIAGIQGITVTGTAVLISSGDQLGVAVSSRKYKDNIIDMQDYSSKIMNLRPVTFTLKDNESAGIQSGLIAEEVYEVFPDIVVLDKAGDPQTVQYHNLPALLLNELQKALKRIEALEEKLSEKAS